MVSHQTKSKRASSLRLDYVKSRCSRTSGLISKQASLEASRVHLKYLEQESVIQKEIADLQSLLKIKRTQCDVEMMEKEVTVMQDARPSLAPSISSHEKNI